MDTKFSGALVAPATQTAQVDTPTSTVPVKTCCGVLRSDVCDCRQFAAEARGVFARPIMCRPASEWNS